MHGCDEQTASQGDASARPAAPGLSAAYDYEYERNGVSSLFMLFAPLDGLAANSRGPLSSVARSVDWAM